jgi:hypothetical protein
MARLDPRVRAGLLVVAATLCVSCILGFALYRKYGPELAAAQDVVTGLIYFLESSGGRFPESEAEFRSADFVETLPSGGIRIHAPAGTRYRRTTHGVEIPSLAPFRIAWGTNLTELRFNEYGRAHDAQGRTVELVSWPSSPPSGKTYSWVLMDIAREIHERRAAASAPSAQPASSAPQP